MKGMRVAGRFKNSDLSLRVGIGAPFGAPLFCVGSGPGRVGSGTGPAASALAPDYRGGRAGRRPGRSSPAQKKRRPGPPIRRRLSHKNPIYLKRLLPQPPNQVSADRDALSRWITKSILPGPGFDDPDNSYAPRNSPRHKFYIHREVCLLGVHPAILLRTVDVPTKMG